MQIILCRRRRSASGKRAIWRARSREFKKASGRDLPSQATLTLYYHLPPRASCGSEKITLALYQREPLVPPGEDRRGLMDDGCEARSSGDTRCGVCHRRS